MEIQKVLTISTEHLSKDTAQKLDKPRSMLNYLPIFNKDEYGWFIYVDFVINPGLFSKKDVPSDLLKVCDYARSKGCEILCLDRDAETTDELPTYEW